MKTSRILSSLLPALLSAAGLGKESKDAFQPLFNGKPTSEIRAERMYQNFVRE